MPVITDIKSQVKNQERASIFVDGVYTFSLSLDQINQNKKVKIGNEISNSELESLKQLSKLGKIYINMLNLILARPRSEFEINTKLKLKKLTKEESEEITSKLKDLGYLNDQSFAKWWIKNRKDFKSISKLKLSSELAQKGVSSKIANQALQEEFSQEDELKSLKDLVAKKQAKYPDRQKLISYLASKGFRYSLIKEALDPEDSSGF